MLEFIESLRQLGAVTKMKPALANYDSGATTGFHQDIRGLNAAIAKSMDKKLITWSKTNWKPMSVDSYKPTKDSEVAAKVDHVLSKLDEFE